MQHCGGHKLAVTQRGHGPGSYCDIWLPGSRNVHAVVPHPGVVAYSKSLSRWHIAIVVFTPGSARFDLFAMHFQH